MVLSIVKWNVHPDKAEAYNEWVGSAVKRVLAVPGLQEFRAYRPVTGSFQIVVTYEFADLASWAAWRSHEDVEKLLDELHTLANDVNVEVWGPSPIVPDPIRPGG
jgi:heme-degrading monooxygenase HmoA